MPLQTIQQRPPQRCPRQRRAVLAIDHAMQYADEDHAPARHHLQTIARTANHMRRLVSDLTDASALDAGRLHPDVRQPRRERDQVHPRRGQVRMSAARIGGETSAAVEFSVTDSGPGIPAVDLPRVFETFAL